MKLAIRFLSGSAGVRWSGGVTFEIKTPLEQHRKHTLKVVIVYKAILTEKER